MIVRQFATRFVNEGCESSQTRRCTGRINFINSPNENILILVLEFIVYSRMKSKCLMYLLYLLQKINKNSETWIVLIVIAMRLEILVKMIVPT